MQDNIVCVVLFKYNFLQVILNACERVFYMKRIESLQAQLKCFRKEHLASILETKNKELRRLRNECQAVHVRSCQFEDELGCYQKLYTKVVASLSASNRARASSLAHSSTMIVCLPPGRRGSAGDGMELAGTHFEKHFEKL